MNVLIDFKKYDDSKPMRVIVAPHIIGPYFGDDASVDVSRTGMIFTIAGGYSSFGKYRSEVIDLVEHVIEMPFEHYLAVARDLNKSGEMYVDATEANLPNLKKQAKEAYEKQKGTQAKRPRRASPATVNHHRLS